jgi:putative phosphoribosyl transferase
MNALKPDSWQRSAWSAGAAEAPSSRGVHLQIGDAQLEGDLEVPGNARGIVVFAHGSGSSRKSPRNRAVARDLNRNGFATVLFDLLTEREDSDRASRFDIALLAERLGAVVSSLELEVGLAHLPVGLFGASTGAAAALTVAARNPEAVAAVVSRGGRPDLAGRDELARVAAPTLLIVGGADTQVLALNQAARAAMTATVELAIVPGATHLFEEPGALERVSALAVEWFHRWF